MDALLHKIDAMLFGPDTSTMRLAFLLVTGGLLGLYIRFLYNRCSASVSNADAVSGIFPLLTMVTTCVIMVVKVSLALSLGLVGALSIVRFRAAIKDPEELVYLFLCIGIGLALGAGHLKFAVVLVFVASIFILGRHFLGRGPSRGNVLLTVTGDAVPHFEDPEKGVLALVPGLAESYVIQRYEVEEGRGHLRLILRRMTAEQAASTIGALRRSLPGCQISYINMDALL